MPTQLLDADAVLVSEANTQGLFVGGTFSLGPGPFTRLEFLADDDETDFASFSTQGTERSGAGKQTGSLIDSSGATFEQGLTSLTQVITITDPVNGEETLVGRVSITEDNGQPSGSELQTFYIFSGPINPNVSYDVTAIEFSPGSSPAASYEYSEFSASSVPCYAPGTLIDTPDGSRLVEQLQVGDLVLTQDHGPQAILWIHSGTVPLEDSDMDAKPVLIKAGSLGQESPTCDLIVSPQHRILLGGNGVLGSWFDEEGFAPAKSLTILRGVRHMKGKKRIQWIHFACERHEVVIANGCPSESLLLGPMVLNGLPNSKRQELYNIFGNMPARQGPLNGPAARSLLKVGEVRRRLAKFLRKKVRDHSQDRITNRNVKEAVLAKFPNITGSDQHFV